MDHQLLKVINSVSQSLDKQRLNNKRGIDLEQVRINQANATNLQDRLKEAGIYIAPGSRITCRDFIIGKRSRINGPILVKGNNTCEIGKYCAFGFGIRIITHNHLTNRANLQDNLQRRLGFCDILSYDDPVIIGNNVWIGDAAIILPGVHIGDGAIVGAGSVVTKNIAPFAVAVGTPAHTLRQRFSQGIIKKLLEIRWWDWPEERMARNRSFFERDLTLEPELDLSRLIVD